MNYRMDEPLHRERAQGMAEFALILPLLLVVVLGLIEMGRLLFIYSAVMTSSREAVRYGSSVGDNTSLPNFRDCAGIRSSSMRMASLAGVRAEDILIGYDHGPGVSASVALPSSCETALNSNLFTLGDRVVVTVTAMYSPLIPLVNIPSFPIMSNSRRTIVREVPLSPPPPAVTQTHLLEFDYSYGDETVIDEPDAGYVMASIGIYYSGTPLSQSVSVPIQLAGDAGYGLDYLPTFSGSVVIPAGSNTGMVNIQILGDLIDEYDEKVFLYLRQPDQTDVALGVLITHTITIRDNDPPPDVGFEFAASSGMEGTGTVNSSAISVNLYIPGTNTPIVSGKPVTVNFTVSGGTATQDDYSILGANLSGTTYSIDIPPGQASVPVYINPVPDSIYELDETVNLSISSAVNATRVTTRSTHTFTIQNDDAPPVVSFVWSGQRVKEGTSGTAMLMLDRVSGIATTVNIEYTHAASVINNRDRCQANKDYDFAVANPGFPGGSIVIPAGSLFSSAAVLLTACEDVVVAEPDETVTARISGVSYGVVGANNTHIFTITESNLTPPTLSFIQAAQVVTESVGTAPVIARLSGPSGQDIQFSYSITGTAVYAGVNVDFTLLPVPGVVNIPAGAAEAVIQVGVINDAMDEADETILFTLATPVNATLGAITQHTLTIQNDDIPGVEFAQTNQTVPEDTDIVNVIVRLSSPARMDVTLPFTVTGTATAGWENDYQVLTGTVLIPVGQLTFMIPIYVNNDGMPEDVETVILTLGQPNHTVLGLARVHTISIQDNDAGCSVSNGPLSYLMFGEGSGALMRHISWPLTNQSAVPLSLYSLNINWPIARTGPYLDEVYVNHAGTGSIPIWTLNVETSPAYLFAPWFGPVDSVLFPAAATKTIDTVFTNVMAEGPYLMTAVFLNQETIQTCSISVFNVYTP